MIAIDVSQDFEDIADNSESVTLESVGENVISNGAFVSDLSGWTSTVSPGDTPAAVWENGGARITFNTSGGLTFWQDVTSASIGSRYRLTFDLYNLSGSANVTLEDSSQGEVLVNQTVTTDGRTTIDFSSSDTLSGVRVSVAPQGAGASMLLDHVTLTRLTETTITAALRRAEIDQQKKPSLGTAIASQLSWHLSAAQLTTSPGVADTIVDSGGNRWVILEALSQTDQSRWHCKTVRLSISQATDRKITIQRASFSKGEGGAEKPSWQNWITNLAAHIQPVDSTNETDNQMRHTPSSHVVYLAYAISPNHKYRVVDKNGAVYHVVRALQHDRIDRHFELHVSVDVWPLP